MNSLDNVLEAKGLFDLDEKMIHLSLAIFASHPKPVQIAIDCHREGFNKNPIGYLANKSKFEKNCREKAALYLGTSESQMILTESTTMGIGLVYGGLKLAQDDEVLTTDHEHFSTLEALRNKQAPLKIISLYEDPFQVSVDEILQNLKKAITEKIKVLALTWVHSCTGVKLPLIEMAQMAKKVNPEIIIVVDAVHAFGVEEFEVEKLGIDFLIAGCHKWLFGPRGTGVVWASSYGLSKLRPIIPSFSEKVFFTWLKGKDLEENVPKAYLCSPGGFQAYEHRFALSEAFELHLQWSKKKVAERISSLNTYFKQKLSPIVSLKTPLDPHLSAGIICFEMKNKNPAEIAYHLLANQIIAGQTPYHKTYGRVTPGLLNSENEADRLAIVLAQLR